MAGGARAARLRRGLRARWNAWVWRRIPPAREVVLSQKNVFIFPSGSGFAFLLLLLALLIAGINYENNLVFALTFLLGGLFVVAILHTYAHLAQLRIASGASRTVFAGEEAGFPVRVRDEGKLRTASSDPDPRTQTAAAVAVEMLHPADAYDRVLGRAAAP